MATKTPNILPQYPTATIVIATSTTISPEVDLGGNTLVGIITPSTFDGTALTFQVSDVSGGTFVVPAASNAASTAYTVTTTASIYTPIDPIVTKGWRFIKIVTSSAQTTTDTILKLVTRPIT